MPTPSRDSPGLANLAAVRDYWLGGEHHSATDRHFADQVVVCAPQLPYIVRRHRAFLRRVVRYLVEAGVRQFLDLGSGLPATGNVHEVAQQIDRDCRVVYVDHDEWVVDKGQRLVEDNDNTEVVCADLRAPEQVLARSELRALLDLNRPVAVLAIDVLHHLSESDGLDMIVNSYWDALCPGSYFALSQMSRDEGVVDGMDLFARIFGVALPSMTFREPMEVIRFFTGSDLVDPGVVPLPFWHPEPGEETDRNPESFPVYGAVGRKR